MRATSVLTLGVLLSSSACRSSDSAGPRSGAPVDAREAGRAEASVDPSASPVDAGPEGAASAIDRRVNDAIEPRPAPAVGSDAEPRDADAEPRDADAAAAARSDATVPNDATVVLFFVDGLQAPAVRTAVEAGATNFRLILEGGVTVETSYATSPAPRLIVPPALQPWGNATSGNVAAHTGCHLNETSEMDDIFLAARRAGIRSMFAGNDANYGIFVTPDFHYAGAFTDAQVLQHAVTHVKSDNARLLRLHFQRVRDFWTGPASATDPSSPYIGQLRQVDTLLGELITALKETGAWERTYVVIASDHGMGQSASSDHPPSTLASWRNYTAFFGPGIKKGSTIPYAELPDLAVLTNHWLGLPALNGHPSAVTLARPGPTGTLLTNIFEGSPRELAHPRYIETYLNAGTYATAGNEYAPYRQAMLRALQ